MESPNWMQHSPLILKKVSEIKAKTLFDVLNDISFTKLPWKDQELKKDQSWMVNRYLSMSPEYLEVVAEVQELTDGLSPEMYYKFYSDLLPKKKFFVKYIKGKNDKTEGQKKLVNFLSLKLQTSTDEMEDYLEILLPQHLNEVKEYVKQYGYDDKSIKREFGL